LKALLTTAEDKGDHYVVNGQKTFITNGHVRYGYSRGKTNNNTDGRSLLIIEASMEGFKESFFKNSV
jgi:alkylation response protein AidB-like acyl-CoA dehydrogenase